MSTKGLMADKRVKEVTLNDAGKAATLTLADPWTFEGSAGPFTLTSVDHGHKIVKGATGGVLARAPRGSAPLKPPAAPKEPKGSPTEAMKRDPGSETPSLAAPLPPGTPRPKEGLFVYRIVRVSDELNREITGWLRTTRRWPKDWVAAHSLQLFSDAMGRDKLHLFEDASRLWTRSDEKAARSAGTAGSPWALENEREGAES